VYINRYLIEIYLYLGLGLFILGKIFSSIFLDIYVLINILGVILILYQFLSFKISFRLTSLGFALLGFIFYLLGNIIYIFDINLGYLNMSDIFFIFQILLKQYFVVKSYYPVGILESIKTIISINLLTVIVSILLGDYVGVYFLDLFYFLESLISMILLMFLNFYIIQASVNFSEFDLDLFILGQLFWLLGDILYSDFHLLNFDSFLDPSDIFFFIGFYFFIKSFNRLNFLYNLNIVKL